MSSRIRFTCFVLCCLVAHRAVADPPTRLTGKVCSVRSGDTLTVIDDAKRHHRIRLRGIDAPESQQAFGREARKGLVEMVFGKSVTFEVVDRDEDGLEVSDLHAAGRFVNAEMLKSGLAWRMEPSELDEFGTLEEEARRSRRGLWADPQPTPPWEWRERNGMKEPSRLAPRSGPGARPSSLMAR